MMMVKITHSNH